MKLRSKKATFRRLLYYFGKQKGKLMLIFISVLCSTSAILAVPMVIGTAIDDIYKGITATKATGIRFAVNFHTMAGIMGLLLLLFLINYLLKFFEEYTMTTVSQGITLSMRKDLSDKLNRLPPSFYDCNPKGEILSRATSDLEKIADSLQEGLTQFFTSVLTVIGAVVLMLTISPLLAIITFITILGTIWATSTISIRSRGHFLDYQTELGKMNASIEEGFTGQLVIKAFNHQQNALNEFDKINNALYTASYKSQIDTYVVTPVIRLINSMGYILMAVMSGIFIVTGKLSLGAVQAFIQYADQANEPIIETSYIMNLMQSALASSERFFEIMDNADQIPDLIDCKTINYPQGVVEFKHVKFGYSDDAILMNDVNIKLNSGDKIAIVGPTGAGKTTLVNLLMRFYEIQSGAIFVDGVNIKEMARYDLRSLFGMVLQDTWLFGGTIRDNIGYSKFDAAEEEIMHAAKLARVDHFVRTLPEGYDTVIDEDASNLSLGQKQLLTIARVILADPSILILDEATSSVDTRTEAEIQIAMNALMQGRTSFIIAHRLSTIRDADLILVMKKGTIIEQGTHMTLLKQKGFYEELYNSQFTNT